MKGVRPLSSLFLLVVILLASTGAVEAVAAEKNVGVLWIGSSGMANRVTKGFLGVMKSDAPDVKVEFKADLPDEAAAAKIFEEWQDSKDAIVFLRSTGAKFLGKHESKVPCFFGGCSNPVTLGAVSSLEDHGGNITGVTYYMNAAQKIKVFKQVIPELSSIGLIVEKGHPSAAIDMEETKAACEAMNISYTEAQCSTEVDILKAGKDLSGKVDLIVLGSQSICSDQAPKLVPIVGKTPMAAYNPKAIKDAGAAFGLTADDIKLGRILAGSVIDVVVKGTPIQEVPVKLDPDPAFLLSETMVKKLSLNIPDELRQQSRMAK